MNDFSVPVDDRTSEIVAALSEAAILRAAERAKAPALVGVLPKSIYHPSAEAATWAQAVHWNRGVNRPVMVIHGRQQVGWTIGNQHDASVALYHDVRPLEVALRERAETEARLCRVRDRAIQMAGATTYNDLINAASSLGQVFTNMWSKGNTTAPVAGNYYDLWGVGGNPQAGSYAGANGSSVQFFDTTTGAFQSFGNVSPAIKNVVTGWVNASAGATPPSFYLNDRCVTYENVPFNNNAKQTFTQNNSPVSPRYNSNTSQGCYVSLQCQAVENATQQSVTAWTYTNNKGVANQAGPSSTTSTNIIVSAAAQTATLGARVVCPCSTAAGTVPTGWPMPLVTGDVGAQQVTDFTTSAATINTGKLLWAMLAPLATIGTGTAGIISQLDFVMQILSMPRVFDGACLDMMMFFPVATAATLTGQYGFVWV